MAVHGRAIEWACPRPPRRPISTQTARGARKVSLSNCTQTVGCRRKLSTEHIWEHISWCNEQSYSFRQSPSEWTQIEHNICSCQAAWSPFWWWPCFMNRRDMTRTRRLFCVEWTTSNQAFCICTRKWSCEWIQSFNQSAQIYKYIKVINQPLHLCWDTLLFFRLARRRCVWRIRLIIEWSKHSEFKSRPWHPIIV